MDFEVFKSYRGNDGLRTGLTESFDLIILDLMLPEMEGTEICRRLRAADITTPIIILTSKSEEEDKIKGLEIGADDYITKPFSILELQARVKAVIRRYERKDHPEPKNAKASFDAKDMHINFDMRKVLLKGERIDLTPKEFDLLVLLASNPGKSYNRAQILNLVWGYDFEGFEHTVNSHINRLRAKIEEDMASPTYILTTWGFGYRFNEDI
ncbi:UNVERIFIED_CONTAM: hypothetical protein GTU68_059452 [Idotea baltica]|nr:hypothetical protein [Idotea baltica]